MKRTKAILVTTHVQECLDAHTFCSKRCSISTQISSEAKMRLTKIKIKITCNWNENQSLHPLPFGFQSHHIRARTKEKFRMNTSVIHVMADFERHLLMCLKRGKSYTIRTTSHQGEEDVVELLHLLGILCLICFELKTLQEPLNPQNK